MFNRKLIFPIILISSFVLFFFNDMGVSKWYQLRKEKKEIQNDINLMINKENLLSQEIYRLENDEEYIKNIAREKFQMVKPGEKVFRIIDRRKIKNK